MSRNKKCRGASQRRAHRCVQGDVAAACPAWAALCADFGFLLCLLPGAQGQAPTHPVPGCLQAPQFASMGINDLQQS